MAGSDVVVLVLVLLVVDISSPVNDDDGIDGDGARAMAMVEGAGTNAPEDGIDVANNSAATAMLATTEFALDNVIGAIVKEY